MQQLTIEHKKTITKKNQKTEQVELENKREVRGVALSTSRRLYRIENSDTYYFQSERSDNIYYFVKFKPDVIEWCSCPDNSYRGNTCKDIFGIIAGIKKGTIIDVSALPKEAKRDNTISKSYRDDEYDF
jgi:hypothetical protein